MPAAISTLARNSDCLPGHASSPRRPPARSPAKKLSPTSRTPASVTAASNASISRDGGHGVGERPPELDRVEPGRPGRGGPFQHRQVGEQDRQVDVVTHQTFFPRCGS